MANAKWIAIAYFSAFIFVYFSYLAYAFIPVYISKMNNEVFEPPPNVANATMNLYATASVMPAFGAVLIVVILVAGFFLFITCFGTYRGV